MGLVMKPSNPAPSKRSRSSLITDAVIATTGIAAVTGSARSRRSALTPSIPGSWMSIRIRCGWCAIASGIPSSALVASMVSKP